MQKLIVTIGAVACLVASAALHAAPITVIAEGVTTEYWDPDGLLPFADPGIGSTWLLTFTYESDSTDRFGDADTALYINPFFDFSVEVGGQVLGLTEETSAILIADRTVPGETDAWVAGNIFSSPVGLPDPSTGAQLRRRNGFTFSLTAEGSSEQPPAVLTSDSLVVPTPLETWDVAEIFYEVTDTLGPPSDDSRTERALAVATITRLTVVPIPAAVWLFGSALVGLGWLRRS